MSAPEKKFKIKNDKRIIVLVITIKKKEAMLKIPRYTRRYLHV